MPELLLTLIVILLVAGFILLWLRLTKTGKEDLRADTDQLRKEVENLNTLRKVDEERIRTLQEQSAQLTQATVEKDASILELNRQLSQKQAEYIALSEKLTEQKAELEKFQERFRTEFKNLANEILEEKSKKFTEQNRTRLEEILKPLGEKIREFEKKVDETYDKESKQRFSLEKEIRNLAELNQQISKEASNLTRALKGQVKTQGNWGEIILESILEKSGLVRDREYFIQSSHTTADGRRLQPDVIVTYPGDRNVVIDAKVSLVAFERYTSGETKEEQDSALREHVTSIRNHIVELSSKNYQDLYQLHCLNFVMLFMPVEPAYLIAMQYDPGLWNFAYDRRVLLISPTNLIAALQMISNLWRVEYQNKNALEIARQSADLLDKFVNFVEDLQDVGKKIEGARQSHDAAMNKLSTGKGNLIRRTEKIRELGARSAKEIPKTLLDKSDED
jgi:DNA recombination protein RmuC